MDSEYDDDDIDRAFEEHRKKNEKYLDLFEKDLEGLGEKTRDQHIENADLFVNDFFYRYEITDLADGAMNLFSFFDFFNGKCLWSTPSSVRKMGASIKKFYKSMYSHGEVGKDDLELVLDVVKENLPQWIKDSEDSLSFGDEEDDYLFGDFLTPEMKEIKRLLSLF